MIKFCSFLTISLAISLLFALSFTVSSSNLSETIEESSFECGLNYNLTSSVPFSFQFFLVAVLFLIFDIEISLVLPFSLEFWSLPNSNNILIVLLILLMSLMYEWKNGKVEWLKWMSFSFCNRSLFQLEAALSFLIFHFFCLILSILFSMKFSKSRFLSVFNTLCNDCNIEAIA